VKREARMREFNPWAFIAPIRAGNVLTCAELHRIEHRIDELTEIIDGPEEHGEWVGEELDTWIEILDRSMKNAKIKELGLRLVVASA
jgi:hypothetical protein